jgi:membrane dipeptidase
MTPSDEALARAEAFIARTALVDGHNDLPYVMRADARWAGDLNAYRFGENLPGRDTDLPKLRAGRVGAQFLAAYVPPKEPRPASYALQQLGLIRRLEAAFPNDLLPGRRADDVAHARAQGKIATFSTIENGAALEERLDALDAYYALGVRLMTLCHNDSNALCDSATDAALHGGLSPFGADVVRRMNALGMIVDLAHVAPRAMLGVLDVAQAPPVWSHSNVKALCAHPRNVPDEVLREVPLAQGVVMATFVPNFLTEASRKWCAPFMDEYGKTRDDFDVDFETLRAARAAEAGPWPLGGLLDFCDHLDSLVEKIGIDHVGIGSDFFGGPQGPGLETAACFPAIFAELMRRGWRDDDLEKVAGANMLRVMRAVEANAAA